ncbi:hypothetical protein KC19_10G026200 [Ceratodon purpureus]|uniref:BPL/LPL catalytic domain-containing protein n=1 Tax=Ceratodon purpureus TaxID=3225 RepID=A0A8T0GL02_CERPU|nr:hypothetical protein KC19_10G026200 [Ceratodon purpureus]
MFISCFYKTMVSKLLKCQSATYWNGERIHARLDCVAVSGRRTVIAVRAHRSLTSCSLSSNNIRNSAISALGFRMQPERDQVLGKVGKFEEGTVGKVEQMENAARKPEGHSVGRAEGSFGKSVGKAEHESVGKTIGKSENASVGKSVGKSEDESVGKSIGKSENESVGKSVGKAEHESVGKSVGKSENESVGKSVGKSEDESVGKSIGKSENESVGKSVGKSENESVGKSVGKAENESVGKLGQNAEKTGEVGAKGAGGVGKAIGKSEEGEGGKGSRKSVGKGEDGHVGKAEGGSVHNQAVGKSSNAKEEAKEFVIAVAGKSESETSYVENLTGAAAELKLPEGATLVAYEQAMSAEDGFRVGVFLDQLMTHQFGKLVLYAPQLPSTHTLLSQNFKVLPVGTLSVADVQFQGKGRAGNSWESPKGCLMFSFTVQMTDGRAVPFLQYVVSLAIIEGIEGHCISKGLQAPEVKIKWPNDLYANGLKVGGVLCTSTYSSKKFNIVIGVGLNVGNRQPTTCLDALLEGINEKAPSLAKDELLAAIISQFEFLFEVFCAQGFSALESNYYKRWLHSGQTVVLEERQEGSTEVSHIPMKIQGLTATGYLRAIDDASETYELHPDGNSFDFLKGLVRQKM